jgi:hypothetical protein
LSGESVVGVEPISRDLVVAPRVSSRARLDVVVSVVVVSVAEQAAVDGVGQLSLRTSQRFPVVFAVDAFAR